MRKKSKKLGRKLAQKIDGGMSKKDIEAIRRAVRQVWSWKSHARKICLARAVGADGFPRCEECKKKVPKVFADHIEPVGDVDDGFLKRLWCSSKELQAICKKCHDKKTAGERNKKSKLKRIGDFY